MKTVLRGARASRARATAARRERATTRARSPREVGFPLVVKPPAGAGARSTFRVDERGRARAGAARSLPPAPTRPVLLEEFVVGEEHSFDAVVDRRQAGLALDQPLPAVAARGAARAVDPVVRAAAARDRRARVRRHPRGRVRGARARSGLTTGLAHMEWFRRADGGIADLRGRRPPAGRAVHDADLVRARRRLLRAPGRGSPCSSVRRRPSASTPSAAPTCAARARAACAPLRGLDEVARLSARSSSRRGCPSAGQAPRGGYEGDGHVIVRHPDTAVVEAALTTIVSNLRVELA